MTRRVYGRPRHVDVLAIATPQRQSQPIAECSIIRCHIIKFWNLQWPILSSTRCLTSQARCWLAMRRLTDLLDRVADLFRRHIADQFDMSDSRRQHEPQPAVGDLFVLRHRLDHRVGIDRDI